MKQSIRAFAMLLFLLASSAMAQDISLLPKYGGQTKTEAQQAADARFLEQIDKGFKGDRRQAASEVAKAGWQLLRTRQMPDAMRRFNQAWLLDPHNGISLWGMAVLEADQGRADSSLALFREAESATGNDLQFAVDEARAISFAALAKQDKALMQEALTRFSNVHARAPQHTANLQNWAIALFETGDYAAAWDKIKLAEATPGVAEIDPGFVKALTEKMARL